MFTNPQASININCHCTRRPDGTHGRNLVVNLDGTSNQYSSKNTNVIEMFSDIDASDNQMKYYKSGIGTYAQPSWKSYTYAKQVAENKIDLAIAWNFEKIILAAYRWLSDNYKAGDRIFLFGFSRGAFQVRALAGMIEKVGLIHKGNEGQIAFAYELYSSIYDAAHEKSAKNFKNTFSVKNVRVHFVGVWDTVSSIGFVRGKTLPLTDSCGHVCAFRHALALDERRVKFLPECIAGPNKPMPPNAKEVWFAGTHSDVGGGSLPNDELNLESVPLLWMENEALMAGLHLLRSSVNWKINDLKDSKPTKSLNGVWWLLECLPFRWKIRSDLTKLVRAPHCGAGRVIYPGQKIHASVAFKATTYYPKANFLPGTQPLPDWNDLLASGVSGKFRGASMWQDHLEMDLFDFEGVSDMVARLADVDLTDGDASHILNRLYFIKFLSGGEKFILEAQNIQQTLERFLVVTDKPTLSFLITVKLLADLLWTLPWARGAIINVPVISTVVQMLGTHYRPAALALCNLAQDDTAASLIIQCDAVPVLIIEMLTSLDCGAALMALGSLMEHQYIASKEKAARALILKHDPFPQLVRMLQGPDCREVAFLLGGIGENDDVRVRILALGAIPALIDMLDGIDCGPAAFALGTLAKDANTLTHLVKSNVTPRLIQMLDGEDCASAARALASLAEETDTRATIFAEIPGLVSKLQATKSFLPNGALKPVNEVVPSAHASSGGDRSAVIALKWLAQDERLRTHIISCDAVKRLIETLEGPNSDEVVITLSWLAEDEDTRTQIVQFNAIPALVRLLESPQCGSAAQILHFVQDDDSVTHVAESTTIQTLVRRLQGTSPRSAVVALKWLSQDERLHAHIVRCDAVKPLVGMLDGPDSDEVVDTLSWLAENEDARTQIVQLNAIPTLVKLLESPQCNSVANILDLIQCDESIRRIIESNAVQTLVGRLQSTSPRSAVAALSWLAQNERLCEHIVRCDAVSPLVETLKGADSDYVISTLSWLAKNEDARMQFVELNAIPALVELLKSPQSAGGAATLRYLAQTNATVRARIIRLGAIPALLLVLRSTIDINRIKARDALVTLASYDDSRPKIVESDMVSTLVGMLDSADTKDFATGALADCAKAGILVPHRFAAHGDDPDEETSEDAGGLRLPYSWYGVVLL